MAVGTASSQVMNSLALFFERGGTLATKCLLRSRCSLGHTTFKNPGVLHNAYGRM